MRAPLPFRAGWWLLALPLVSGCDLALMGLVGPGPIPGTGWPLTGTVVDARTRLPIGGATVHSGLGSTITDAQGRFNLYGRLSSREISFSRAGYTAITIGGVKPGEEPDEYALEPLYADAQTLPKRFLELRGQVTDASGGLLPDGLVLYAGQSASLSNGSYALTYGSESPGKVLTSVFAAGRTSGRYQQDGGAQPFSFTSFGYVLKHWPLGDTVPQSQQPFHLQVPGTVPFRTVQVRYGNVSGFASVQTDIALDFGVAGFVPVARALGSNQAVSVPDLGGLKYYLRGEAKDATGRNVSSVSIVTNDPGQAAFQLLAPPKVLSPVSGATFAGARPTFSWTPVASESTGVVYKVTLLEGAVGADGSISYESKPKWIATTKDAYVTYPGFSASDVNAAALRADRRYLWHLRAVDSLDATELPTRRSALAPFRVRQREAETLGYTFSL